MSTNNENAGSRGRTADQSEKIPGGTFKFNRRDMSYQEVCDMKRQTGDLFAVFRSQNGTVRVQYATLTDYAEVAIESMKRVKREGGVQFRNEDVMFIIGGTMITRLHPYISDDFVHLLNNEMGQVFDLCAFADWFQLNKALFQSPAQAAVERDAEDEDAMRKQYLENTAEKDADEPESSSAESVGA